MSRRPVSPGSCFLRVSLRAKGISLQMGRSQEERVQALSALSQGAWTSVSGDGGWPRGEEPLFQNCGNKSPPNISGLLGQSDVDTRLSYGHLLVQSLQGARSLRTQHFGVELVPGPNVGTGCTDETRWLRVERLSQGTQPRSLCASGHRGQRLNPWLGREAWAHGEQEAQ